MFPPRLSTARVVSRSSGNAPSVNPSSNSLQVNISVAASRLRPSIRSAQFSRQSHRFSAPPARPAHVASSTPQLSTTAGFSTTTTPSSSTEKKKNPQALLTDVKLEDIRNEVSQLVEQELQVRARSEWTFGAQFLEKYSYEWEESEAAEVTLTRELSRQRIRIRFNIVDEEGERPAADDRAIVDANTVATQRETAKPEFRGKPMAIEVSRLDVRGNELGKVVFYCQCGPDNSIVIDGLGGEDEDSWGLSFDSLSPMLKDKIIDYLCELEIAGDVSKYVREYADHFGETNISSLKRLKEFFVLDTPK